MRKLIQFFEARKRLTFFLAIVWTIVIFIGCSMPGRELPKIGLFDNIDKVIHFIFFAVFFGFWYLITLKTTKYAWLLFVISAGANPNLQTSWFDGCMGGSPGAAFSNCVENPLINEINYNSSPTADAGDWIEVHTKTNAAVNLSGWKITDKNNTGYSFANGTSIPPYGYLTVYNDPVKFQSQYPSVPNAFGPINFGLSSIKDIVKLFDNTGRVFQSVCYLSTAPYTPLPNGGGYALQLIDSTGNLNKAASWDRSCTSGTPGAKNLYPCGGTGLQLYDQDFISLYPNPANEVIHVSFNNLLRQNIMIEMTDMTGKTIFKKQYHSQYEIVLPLSEYSAGIYLIKIECDGKRYREKINKL